MLFGCVFFCCCCCCCCCCYPWTSFEVWMPPLRPCQPLLLKAGLQSCPSHSSTLGPGYGATQLQVQSTSMHSHWFSYIRSLKSPNQFSKSLSTLVFIGIYIYIELPVPFSATLFLSQACNKQCLQDCKDVEQMCLFMAVLNTDISKNHICIGSAVNRLACFYARISTVQSLQKTNPIADELNFVLHVDVMWMCQSNSIQCNSVVYILGHFRARVRGSSAQVPWSDQVWAPFSTSWQHPTRTLVTFTLDVWIDISVALRGSASG